MGARGQWFLVIGERTDDTGNYVTDAVVVIAPAPSFAREWAERNFAVYDMYPLYEKIVELDGGD